MRKTIGEKLRRVNISPQGRAIIDAWFGVGDSPFAELTVTSDGCLLGRENGDCGFNAFLGQSSNLRNNVLGMVKVLDGEYALTEEELEYLEATLPK
jgi:hypothetical protein